MEKRAGSSSELLNISEKVKQFEEVIAKTLTTEKLLTLKRKEKNLNLWVKIHCFGKKH